MKITNIGTDIVEVNEDNYQDDNLQRISRIHLIKLSFQSPSNKLITDIFRLFPKTNRFVIENNIREYNSVFRNTSKKYYVMNKEGVEIITFFRRNNKILLNFNNLLMDEVQFFTLNNVFRDLLRNVEVIAINKDIFDNKIDILNTWNGNVIITTKEKVI